MTIVFRVDASIQMGMGHLSRCLTLANGWRTRGQQCHFICRHLPGLPIDQIREQGHRLTLLPHPKGNDVPLNHREWLTCDSTTDATKTLSACDYQTPFWLVIDHYAIDKKWQKRIRQSWPKLNIMVIDDLADREHEADLLLDQTLDRMPTDYAGKLSEDCHLLLGTHYALLRSEFAAQRTKALQRRHSEQSPHRVLIAPGGTDPSAIGERALRAVDQLRAAGWALDATMIVNEITPHLQRYRHYAAEGRWQLVLNANNVAELMTSHDVAIGAAGTSSWERCALGLPTLLITAAANQQNVSQALAAHKAVVAMGDDSSVTADALANALSALLGDLTRYQAMAEQAAILVDGHGVERVINQMRTQSTLNVSLSAMREQDGELLFYWQNIKLIRRHFRNPRPPSLFEHDRWYKMAIKDKRRQLLRIDVNDIPVGMVRIDEKSDGAQKGEISILIDPAWHGLGVATRAIRKAIMQSPLSSWVAEVSPDNLSSQRVFTKLGFQRDAPHRFSLTREALLEQRQVWDSSHV